MSNPSNRERKALGRTLKDFAFEQSPMFQSGQIQSMEHTQAFEFIESTPETIPGMLHFDQTKIVLGFYATRHSMKAARPVYSYEVSIYASSLIHPRQLQLSQGAWHELTHEFIPPAETEDNNDAESEDSDIIDGIVVLEPEEVKDEIIDNITDSGTECELYQKSKFSFASCELAIESSFEKGVLVGNKLYDMYSTYQTGEDFDDWSQLETPDGTLYVPPKIAPDELSIGDEIETRTQFFDIVRQLGLDQEAAENDLLPHEDKLKEMLYIIDCLRKRRINVR